ncbi:MAG TPA: dihydroorotase [Candidatus Omnitrophota bacterium]|nr:dihydroorotase [Candidatus Omnitrophota bacterium]
MTHSLLIKNGTLVSSQGRVQADVLVRNGRIAKVGPNLSESVERIIDASGLFVIPGALDPQVHFREPGKTYKEDLHTGSMGCAAGGITGFFDMPNNDPSITTRELMAEKKRAAASKCVVNYNFFIGATPENLEEVNAVKNVCGIKIFMGSSTGNLLVEKESDLERIFANGHRLIAVHAEDNDVIRETKKMLGNGPFHFEDHPKIRNAKAALTATQRAVRLSLKYGRRLHILHVTSGDEVEFLRAYRDYPQISAEVCPQHLVFSAPDVYNRLGSFGQMNPPIRDYRHAPILWSGLKDGTLKCIATDHAPHTKEEKALPYGECPSGMPGVETSMAVMLDQVNRRRCTLEEVVLWMCENPVKLYSVADKGKVAEGFDADITLVDLNKKKIVRGAEMQTKVKWTPFEGMTLQGWPVTTIVGGQVVFENGKVNEDVRGKEIKIKD